MKTAIIDTSFWDDDDFMDLTIEEKTVFFFLISNPIRTMCPLTKLNIRTCAFRTDLTTKEVEKSLQILHEKNLIEFFDGFYFINNFVIPQKNRYAKKINITTLEKIPVETREKFSKLNDILDKIDTEILLVLCGKFDKK